MPSRFCLCVYESVKDQLAADQIVVQCTAVNFHHIAARCVTKCRCRAGRFTQTAAKRHNTIRCLCFMRRGNAASCGKQVFASFRAKRSIGDCVVGAVFKIVVARTASLGIVDVDVVVAADHAVVKLRAGNQIFLCERVFALDHAAFPHADLHTGGEQNAVLKAVDVFF